jgi:hypothetical protein
LACRSLTVIDFGLPSKLVRIDDSAFAGCCALGSLCLPASLEYVGRDCFGKANPLSTCGALDHIDIERGSRLREIGESAFAGLLGLQSICIPASVLVIGKFCFRRGGGFGCGDLAEVLFEDGSRLSRIEEGAFAGCWGISEIWLPLSLEAVGPSCWASCKRLERIEFEGGSRLSRIGSRAFAICSKLEEIAVPAGVEVIEACAFANCAVLSSVLFEEGSKVRKIEEGAFSGCSALASIFIPRLVEVIGKSAFCWCSALRTISFEEGSCLRRIESLAFSYCGSLRTFVIPASVEEIEGQWTGTYTPDLVFFESAAGLKRMIENGAIDLEKEYRMETVWEDGMEIRGYEVEEIPGVSGRVHLVKLPESPAPDLDESDPDW